MVIIAPVGIAIIWLVLSGLHAPDRIISSAEALLAVPIVILAWIVFKSALQTEREIQTNELL